MKLFYIFELNYVGCAEYTQIGLPSLIVCVGNLVLEVKLFINEHFDIEMRKSYGLLPLSTIISFTAS